VKSPEGLQASVASEILPALLKELKQGDVLVTLNALEMLTPLALNTNGLLFLDQNGVLDELEASLESVQKDPLGTILLPGLYLRRATFDSSLLLRYFCLCYALNARREVHLRVD